MDKGLKGELMVMTGITAVTLLHWLLIRVDPYLIHFNCESGESEWQKLGQVVVENG